VGSIDLFRAAKKKIEIRKGNYHAGRSTRKMRNNRGSGDRDPADSGERTGDFLSLSEFIGSVQFVIRDRPEGGGSSRETKSLVKKLRKG